MSAISDNLLRRWRGLPILWRLIAVNTAVFLILRLTGIVALIGGWNIIHVVDVVAVPAEVRHFIAMPWTLLTYMFAHYDLFHILFNMLALFWFGKLFLFRCTSRQLMALYLYGGAAGALLFLAASVLFPAVAAPLIGASAAVMALLVAIAVMMPDFEIYLMFIGRLKLKWMAVGTLVMFTIGLAGDNAGGHVAHLGGMGAGLTFGLLMNRGIDITAPFNRLLDRMANAIRRVSSPRKKQFGNKTPRQPDPANDRRDLDEILDKIKKSGYSSLSADERRRLFDVSSRIK